MIIGTFNGWNIVQIPSSPAPKSIEFTANDTVAVSTSPFTQQQQIQDWQASFLEASVSLPPLTHVQAQSWIAWTLQCKGQAGVFQIGDAAATAPLGTAAGTPQVNGANQAGYTLATDGWTASAAGVLLAGDWVQVGYRLYRNLDTVNANGSGQATLNLWPQLRESPADNAALVLTNTTGLFRLKANARKWSVTEGRIYGFQFEIREAL